MDNLTNLSQWDRVYESNQNISLCAFLLCDYKKMSTVHLSFPVEKKYADHNENKNMLLTVHLFSKKKKVLV